MVEVAVFDATIITVYVDPYRQKEAEQDRDDALAWMGCEKETPIRFDAVCEALGFDPELFRERSRIKKVIIKK